jgi:antitoxin component YwqK of YwqJK toxin-antitoxin module
VYIHVGVNLKMTIRTLIFALTLLTTNEILSQCNTIYYRALPKLSQDTFSTLIINDDSFFTFQDSINWNYVQSEQVPDTSKIDGTWLLLRSNNPDSILLKVTYLNGLRNGELICRHKNGNLLEHLNYKNGKLHGKQLDYHYDSGKIWREQNYTYGRKDGIQTSYYENGQVDDIQNYQDSLRHGEQKGFWRDCTKSSYSFYINGQPHGEHRRWHKNGQPWTIEHYQNGHKQGEFYKWDEQGRITEYAYFKDNIPIGVSFGFWDGKQTFERYFENGQLKREIYEYYTSPQKYFETKRKRKTELDFSKIEHCIKSEAVYTDSTIIVRTYYPSGQLKSEEPVIFVEEKDCK